MGCSARSTARCGWWRAEFRHPEVTANGSGPKWPARCTVALEHALIAAALRGNERSLLRVTAH